MAGFPDLASARLGVGVEAARKAAAAVLATVGDFVEPREFEALVAPLQATDDWLPERKGTYDKIKTRTGLRRRAVTSSGIFTASGQSAGGIQGLLGAVKGAGVPSDQATPFVALLVGYLREKAPAQSVAEVLDRVPALRVLAVG